MKKCQGSRRSWKSGVLATRKCRRKAYYIVKTSVGVSRTLYSCGDPECQSSLASGYPAITRELV